MRLSRSVAGIRVRQWAAVPVLVAAAVVSASAQPAQGERPALRVVSAAPGGELATLAEANEIRVVFSEPMVALGSVPARVTAPFFSRHPGNPRLVPLVGDHDPHLHPRREAAAAVCDQV